MKKLTFIPLVLLVVFMTLLGGCSQPGGNTTSPVTTDREITVSAAMTLKDVMEELKDGYMQQHPEVKINLNLASSGALQRQIEEGAPVDLFISAGVKQMDALDDKGLIDKTTRMDLLRNDLVLITREDGPPIKEFRDLTSPEVKKISLGMPETAPVGMYAKETLVNLGLWDKLQPKLVPGKNVRQVLTYVETGAVDAGFVYRSDAMKGHGIRVVLTVPDDLHKPIVYPAAILKNANDGETARSFLDYLTSPEAAAVFQKHGFKTGVSK